MIGCGEKVCQVVDAMLQIWKSENEAVTGYTALYVDDSLSDKALLDSDAVAVMQDLAERYGGWENSGTRIYFFVHIGEDSAQFVVTHLTSFDEYDQEVQDSMYCELDYMNVSGKYFDLFNKDGEYVGQWLEYTGLQSFFILLCNYIVVYAGANFADETRMSMCQELMRQFDVRDPMHKKYIVQKIYDGEE